MFCEQRLQLPQRRLNLLHQGPVVDEGPGAPLAPLDLPRDPAQSFGEGARLLHRAVELGQALATGAARVRELPAEVDAGVLQLGRQPAQRLEIPVEGGHVERVDLPLPFFQEGVEFIQGIPERAEPGVPVPGRDFRPYLLEDPLGQRHQILVEAGDLVSRTQRVPRDSGLDGDGLLAHEIQRVNFPAGVLGDREFFIDIHPHPDAVRQELNVLRPADAVAPHIDLGVVPKADHVVEFHVDDIIPGEEDPCFRQPDDGDHEHGEAEKDDRSRDGAHFSIIHHSSPVS